MKILFVNMYYYPNMIGGAEHSLKLLAEGLYKKGIDVSVYTLDGEKNTRTINCEVINGVKIYRGYSKSIFRRRIQGNKQIVDKIINGIHSFWNPLSNKQLKRIVKEVLPNIIHTNNPVSISYWIWKYARKRHIKLVHTLRDYWLLDPTTVIGNSAPLFVYFYRKYTRMISNKFIGKVTAPSQRVLDIFEDAGYFQNAKKQKVVNCIDFDYELLQENITKKMQRTEKKIKFLFAGNLTENKGIIQLLEAFKKNKNCNLELVVCGNGPLEHLVINECKEDDRIKFLGKLNKEKLNEQYAKSDVLLVPSLWIEPFGRVIIEGAQYGLPVIGSNRGGILEVINTLKNGECVNPESIEDLSEKIYKFSDREYIKKYIKNIEMNIKEYSLDKQVERFLEIYG